MSRSMTTPVAERTVQAEIAPPPQGNVVPYQAPPPVAIARTYPPKIAKALLAVTREIGAVEKHGKNTFHNYHYQKWEDVLNRIGPLLVEQGLIIQQSEVARSLFENDQLMAITYAFTIVNEDGEVWPDQPVWTAISRARDQKGTPDDKSANKCHTQAHKYFLLHLFNIKTEDVADDSDGDAAAKPKPPKPGSTAAKAYVIGAEGHDQHTWSAAFIAAIEVAALAEIEQFIAANGNSLSKLGKYPDLDARVKLAIAQRRAALAPQAQAKPKPPKPPKPAAAEPAKPARPDPKAEPLPFLEWLKVELGAVAAGDDFETLWNDRYAPLVEQLDPAFSDDAMAFYRQTEARIAP